MPPPETASAIALGLSREPAVMGFDVSSRQDGVIFARMGLRRGDVADAAVAMFELVPNNRASWPAPDGLLRANARRRKMFS